MKNYWKIKAFSLFATHYVYVDHRSYLADQLFIQYQVSVKFKQEMLRENSPYCMIFCKVQKKDTERFEKALSKLNDKMLLLGYKDYQEICKEVEEIIHG